MGTNIPPIGTPPSWGFRGFATFLRGYMGVMPIVTAAFAPLITLAHVIPIYQQQAKSLACMSGLLGFLCVAWVFYARHSFAAVLFKSVLDRQRPPKLGGLLGLQVQINMVILPLVLIVLSVLCYFKYSIQLEGSITDAQGQQMARNLRLTPPVDYPMLLRNAPTENIVKREAILAQQDYPIEGSYWLSIYYLGIFLCAELAFVIMATREYLQSLLHFSDEDVLGINIRTALTTAAPQVHDNSA